jgi:hypothetical protein
MSDLKFKLVYQDWVQLTNTRLPIANGLHPSVVAWMQKEASEKELSFNGNQYCRIWELEKEYFSKGSGVVFQHCSLLYFFKKHYGEDSIVGIDEVNETDDITYFLPYELDRGNLGYIYDNFDFNIDGTTNTYSYADTLGPRLLELLKTGKVKPILFNGTEPSYDKNTLLNVENAFVKIGVPGTDVNLLQGNFRTDYQGRARLGTAHASMQQQAEIASRYPIERSSLGYLCDYVRETDLDTAKLRSKKFICWNRAMNRPHRVAIFYLALKHNLLKDGIFSFIHSLPNDDPVGALGELVDGTSEELTESVNTIVNLMPYEVDTQDLTPDGKMGFQSNENNKKELYEDSYIHIVSETQFDASGSPFMTEKTFRPILNLQPFIYIGNYKALEELRRLGYKTFHPFIDESYDLEQDPKKRLALIEKEIVRFANMSLEQVHDFYYSVQEITKHNQRQFLTFKNYNPLTEFFEDNYGN